MNLIEYKIPSVAEIKKENESIFEVVSLFAGGGGSSTGYRMAGGKVVAINEFVEEARKTYSANWPDTIILSKDIKNLCGDDFLKAIGKKKGELDLLDGSPPCSAFSTAGKRSKNWGKIKYYSDTKQDKIEDLFFEYIRILRDIMPKIFVAENVSGLAKGVSKGYLNLILRELRASQYHVEAKILDAQYLGIPQTRQRLIFIGVRNDLYSVEIKGKLHPKPLGYKITIKQAFKGLNFTEQDKLETDLSKYKTGRLLKDIRIGKSSDKFFNLVKADPNKQSGCITQKSSDISAAAVRHWDNRAFTISELKRLMSVPDDYILTGSYRHKSERLGRMVPPLMMKAIADNLVKLGVFNGDTKNR